VPDSGLGRELALENPDAFFLSPSGECFHNVTVTGGKQRAEGPLSMKRELRDALRTLEDLERTLQDGETRVLMMGREIKELTSLLDRLEEEKREAEKQAMTSGHMLQQLDSELGRVGERLGVSRSELQRLATERAEQETVIHARKSEITVLEEQRVGVERHMAVSQERLVALKSRRDLAAQNTSQHIARVAGLEERHRSASAVLERIESLVTEMRERVYTLRTQIDTSVAEKVQRENENQLLANQRVELEGEQNPGEARERLLQFESEQIRARLLEIDEALRSARQLLDQARERRGELGATAAQLQSDAQYMAESCLNDLGVQRHELMADATIPIVAGEALAIEDQAYREMRTRLDNLGPVNMMALEEYKETAERHTFLETQRQDLLDSIQNTIATIKEIDTVSRQKFEEAFHKINENFQL